MTGMVLCDSCGKREAEIYQPHTGRRLCRQCFIGDVKERTLAEVRRYGMIRPSDRVLLALSGGKDSFVLLDIMAETHDPSKLVGLSIEEGIAGYNRREDMEKIRKYASERGVDVIFTSIREHVGHSLDEIVARSQAQRLNVSPCTYCGTLRRRIINQYAKILGVDRTATAHNLDDEAQTAIMNILRGDPVRLIRQHPLAPRLSRRFVQRVKPLRKIYEWETTMYSYLKGFRFQETECRYIEMRPTLRAKVREHLYRLEEKHPGSLLRLLELVDRLVEKTLDRYRGLPELPACRVCGEPTSYNRGVCKVCELLSRIGVLADL